MRIDKPFNMAYPKFAVSMLKNKHFCLFRLYHPRLKARPIIRVRRQVQSCTMDTSKINYKSYSPINR